MHVTTVRGRRYENILIRKFNGRKFFDTKISRITVYDTLPVFYSYQTILYSGKFSHGANFYGFRKWSYYSENKNRECLNGCCGCQV